MQDIDSSDLVRRRSFGDGIKKVTSNMQRMLKKTGSRGSREAKRETIDFESTSLRESTSSLTITIPEGDLDEGIYILPLDVISIIMSYMTMRQLGVISQVCKYWRSFCIQLIEGKCFPSNNITGRKIKLSKSITWSSLAAEEEPQTNEYKIVVLGSGASGKSCLIRRLMQNAYVEKYDPTIEDTYSKEVMVDGQMCQLTIVDTGVGEYQALTDGYIITAQGVMILYAINSRSSFDYAAKMRKRILELKRKSERPPIILIGTKLDLVADRIISREEAQKMANAWNPEYYHNYFELTSKEAQPTTLEAFNEMVRQIEDSRQHAHTVKEDGKKCTIM